MRDQDAFEALYEAERPRLVRMAFLMTGQLDLAQDLTQEAFTRAAVRWSRISKYDQPDAWLRLVVARLAIRARTSASRISAVAPPERSTLDPPLPDPELVAALNALPSVQRWCVVLHHVEDQSVADIARQLRLPEGTVRSHLHRGRSALASMLQEGSRDDL